MIVGSILLAFAIDAGWNEMLDRAEADRILRSLRIDFQASEAEAQDVAETHRSRRQRFIRFEAMTEDEIGTIASDSIAWHYVGFLDPRSLDPVLGTLDAIVSSGRLGLIDDDMLRGELTTFRNRVDDSREELGWLQGTSVELWLEFSRMGGPWRIPQESHLGTHLPFATHADLIRIHRDTELMGLIRLNQDFGAAYEREVRMTAAIAQRVLERIDLLID